jgi:uncharacterized membrane protein
LAYLLLPAVIFLVIEPFKDRRFVRFHCFQALFYFGATICLWMAVFVVASILSIVGIGFLIWMLSPFVSLAVFVGWVILVVKAAQGQEFRLPVIGDLAAKQV